MRVKKMTIEEGRRVGISQFFLRFATKAQSDNPNFHKTGSVRGMKRLYYGADCLLVRSGDYIYNVSAEPAIYNQATI